MTSPVTRGATFVTTSDMQLVNYTDIYSEGMMPDN